MWLRDSLTRHDLQALLQRLIERVPVFAGFSEKEMFELLNRADKRLVEAGDCIIREGDNGKVLFVMISGEARVTKRGDGYRQHELGAFGSGDCFGEMSLVDNSPRSATVEAVTQCVLIRIQESDCWNNTKLGARIFRNIAGILAQRLRDLHATILDKGKAESAPE